MWSSVVHIIHHQPHVKDIAIIGWQVATKEEGICDLLLLTWQYAEVIFINVTRQL